jgi:hypothetical protein
MLHRRTSIESRLISRRSKAYQDLDENRAPLEERLSAMSVLALEVGQTAVGTMTFTLAPPSDGAVASDTPAVATIALAADMVTWTLHAIGIGTANMTYTGTSMPPDVGPCVVLPMVVTVTAVPLAEGGDFAPSGAVITGP